MISVQQISGRYRFVSVAESVVLGREIYPSVVDLDFNTEVLYGLIYDDEASGEPDYVTVVGDALESFTLAPVLDAWSARWVVDESAERALAATETAEGVASHLTVYGESDEAFELGHTLSIISGDHSQEEAQASTALVIHEVAEGQVPDVDGAAAEAIALACTSDGESVLVAEDSAATLALDIASEVATGEAAVVSMIAAAGEALTLGADLSVTSSGQDQESTQASRTLSITETAVGTAEHLTASVSEALTLGRTSAGTGAEPVAVSRTAETALGVSDAATGVSALPPAVVTTASESITLGRDQSTTVQDQDTEDTQASRALGRTETATGTAEHLNAAASESRTLGKTSAGSVVTIPDVSRSATRVLTRSEWAFGSASAVTPVSRAVVESRTLGKLAAGSIYIPPQDAVIQVTYNAPSVAFFESFDRAPNGMAHIQIRASFGQVYSSQYVMMVGDPPVIGVGGPDAWVNAETVNWGETVPSSWSLLQIQLPFGGSWININLNPASIPAGRTVTSLPGQIRIVKPPL